MHEAAVFLDDEIAELTLVAGDELGPDRVDLERDAVDAIFLQPIAGSTILLRINFFFEDSAQFLVAV